MSPKVLKRAVWIGGLFLLVQHRQAVWGWAKTRLGGAVSSSQALQGKLGQYVPESLKGAADRARDSAQKAKDLGKAKGLEMQMALFGRALKQYRQVNDSYPEDFERFLKEAIGDQVERVDPWGRSFRFTRQGHGFDLRSAGADGAFDTGDDLVVASGS